MIALVLAALLIYRFGFGTDDGEKQSSQNTSGSAKNVETYVKAAVVKPEMIKNVLNAKGSVIPNEEVVINSEISGKIVGIHFKEGDRVAKGQLLVSIEDDELQAQLAQQEHLLEFLEKKAIREEKLNAKGGVSDEQYEATVRDLKTTKSQIDFIKAQIEKTKIHAPFSGILGLRFVSEGGYVVPADKITDLIDVDPLKIDFNIPEKYMGVVKKGNPISFTVEGITEHFSGKVYAIEPKIDPETRTIRLRAISPNTDRELLPGAFAQVEIVLEEIDQALCVPTQSIIPEMNTKKLYLIKNGKAKQVEVETGLRLAKKIQVTNGIQAGDTVLTSGLLQVRNGTEVSITEIVDMNAVSR